MNSYCIATCLAARLKVMILTVQIGVPEFDSWHKFLILASCSCGAWVAIGGYSSAYLPVMQETCTEFLASPSPKPQQIFGEETSRCNHFHLSLSSKNNFIYV